MSDQGDRKGFHVISGGLGDNDKGRRRLSGFDWGGIGESLSEESQEDSADDAGIDDASLDAVDAVDADGDGSLDADSDDSGSADASLDAGPGDHDVPEFSPEPEFDRSSVSSEGYRWAWVEIDRKAIFHNMQEFRKRIEANVRLMAVVKCDGYGHGAVECAKVAVRAGANWLGVATVKEGMELRDAGIIEPILVLSQPPKESIPAIRKFNLVPAVFTIDFAVALGEAAAARGRVADYHLAINTGMNRVGVWCSEVAEFLRAVSHHGGLRLQGTFTHFATADSHDDYMFRLQLRRFNGALDQMREMEISPGIVHSANSAAAIRYKESHFDMVRIGISLYGLHPSTVTRGMIELWPAMSVHGRVVALNDVPVGEGVGYGMSYRSPGNVRIATVPLGYGDGLSRQLSNRMSIIYKGKFYPQVGNICMDQFMFEANLRSTMLNPATVPEIGDEILVIGREGDVYLHLDEMADALGSINYELACRFGMRLDRVYR